jgi:hypothetical protein
VSHSYSPSPLWSDASVFMTITGTRGRPEVLWTRKPDLAPLAGDAKAGADPCARPPALGTTR